MSSFSIIDFHCDLLLFLQSGPDRTAEHFESRCSYPQLTEGGVKIQILPIFTEGGSRSSKNGREQVEIFRNLPIRYPHQFSVVQRIEDLETLHNKQTVATMLAVENASSFCSEDDDLLTQWRWLEEVNRSVGKIAYISLTWNFANRFGGGALTKTGLKDDGKKLLELMDGKKIPVDLSHASDALAHDIFTYIDQKQLDVPIIASHSNCRSITKVPRNLPDELIREIIKRDGLIGLNMIRYFVASEGEKPNKFLDHLHHLVTLGGEKNVCFGLDFFCENDVHPIYRKPPEKLFFPDFQNSSCYPQLLEMIQNVKFSSEDLVSNISSLNALRFLKKLFL